MKYGHAHLSTDGRRPALLHCLRMLRDGELDRLSRPLACRRYAGFSQLIIHGVPNRSVTIPKRSAQKVS